MPVKKKAITKKVIKKTTKVNTKKKVEAKKKTPAKKKQPEKKIAKNEPLEVKKAKNSIKKGLNMSLSDGLFFEIECYNRTIPTKDRLEGILAFNEKRPPKFEGH